MTAATARALWKAASDDGVIARKSVKELTDAEWQARFGGVS